MFSVLRLKKTMMLNIFSSELNESSFTLFIVHFIHNLNENINCHERKEEKIWKMLHKMQISRLKLNFYTIILEDLF